MVPRNDSSTRRLGASALVVALAAVAVAAPLAHAAYADNSSGVARYEEIENADCLLRGGTAPFSFTVLYQDNVDAPEGLLAYATPCRNGTLEFDHCSGTTAVRCSTSEDGATHRVTLSGSTFSYVIGHYEGWTFVVHFRLTGTLNT